MVLVVTMTTMIILVFNIKINKLDCWEVPVLLSQVNASAHLSPSIPLDPVKASSDTFFAIVPQTLQTSSIYSERPCSPPSDLSGGS